MISFPEAVESRLIGISAIHHLPCGGEGLSVRIKNNSVKGAGITGQRI